MFLTTDIYWNVSTGYNLDNKGNVTQSLLSAHTVQSGEKGGKKTIPVSAQKKVHQNPYGCGVETNLMI